MGFKTEMIVATAQNHIAHNGRLLSYLSLPISVEMSIGHKLQVCKASSSKIIIPIFNSRLVFLTSATGDRKHRAYGWSVDLVDMVDLVDQ